MLRKNQEGATAVEFAIILPLLVILTFGIIEFSLIVYNKVMLANAGREGARAGVAYSFNPNDINDATDDTYYPDDASIEQVVLNHAQDLLVTFGSDVFDATDIDIDPAFALRTTSGDSLKVTVTYHYDFLVLPNFMGGIDLGAETVMRLE